MSKVYIKTDDQNRVVGLEGGYSECNITDPENWLLIDEGDGDRYNLCQTHYLSEPLQNDDGVYVWKYEDDVKHRTAEEIAADTPPPPPPTPTPEERIAELEAALAALLGGETDAD